MNKEDFGKIPPQAVEVETAVLGAILLEKPAITKAMNIIKDPEAFYKSAHIKIYKAALNLFAKGEPIDILTVMQELRTSGDLEDIGGPYYLTILTGNVASAAHIEQHAAIIQQKYIGRQLISQGNDITEAAFDDTVDPYRLLDDKIISLIKIRNSSGPGSGLKTGAIAKDRINRIESIINNEIDYKGISSGIDQYDKLTYGFHAPDLTIVAARPAMGKTAFVMSVVRNMVIDQNIPVGIFSLEMSSEQLMDRLLVNDSQVDNDKIRKPKKLSNLELDKLKRSQQKLEVAPIYINDAPGLNIVELRAKAIEMKAQYGVQLIAIDYLQLMRGTGKHSNRESEISQISREVKAIAKELNIPIIALSQLNRSVETRGGDKRPKLSDLRESGAIEQDADNVMFIHRPEYYGDDFFADGESTRDMAEIIYAKHRNGATNTVITKFYKHTMTFMDIYDPRRRNHEEEAEEKAFREFAQITDNNLDIEPNQLF